MCRCCFIIPADVLKRLSKDKRFSEQSRKKLLETAVIDRHIRKLRVHAQTLTAATFSLATSRVAVAPSPAFTIYNCQTSQTLPGTPVPNAEQDGDADAQQICSVTSAVATFYKEVFGRNSIDGNGMTMMSSEHYGDKYNNAFWNGSQMVYGDGDGEIFADLCHGDDVVGHELTHGVTQYTLQLGYTGDAGGLNEGNSDVFGSMFKQWRANQDVTQADWLIGSNIMGASAKQKGYNCLRNLSKPDDPGCLAPQPTTYTQITPGMDPHYSSGVPNFAFYKMAMAIGGKSWEKAGQIWYRTLTGLGTSPKLSMKSFAGHMRSFAMQMYPGDQTIQAAVDEAWKEVGL